MLKKINFIYYLQSYKNIIELNMDSESYAKKGKELLSRRAILPDYKAAFSLFEEGALQNEPESLYMLAECYFHGLGISKDLAKASYYYHLAEASGHPVDPILYERLESGGRDLTQAEIDVIVKEFYKSRQ